MVRKIKKKFFILILILSTISHRVWANDFRDTIQKVTKQIINNQLSSKLIKKLGLGTRLAATILLANKLPFQWIQLLGSEQLRPDYLLWPLPGHRLGRGFYDKEGERYHHAIDITADKGTPVISSYEGIVGYSDNKVKGYGNLIMLFHSGGWVTLYAHLNKMSVSAGDIINEGEKIGEVGSTGISKGYHLHFALINNGRAIDPVPYFKDMPVSNHYKRISYFKLH